MTRLVLILALLPALASGAGSEGASSLTSSMPAPTTDIGTALQGGWATWCAPTPTHCRGWGGDAMLGAVPSFHYGDEPYLATVRHGDREVVVTVVSYCACGDRNGVPTVIDLSPAAFQRLAPLDRGVIAVEVEAGGSVALPPTDTEPTYMGRRSHD